MHSPRPRELHAALPGHLFHRPGDRAPAVIKMAAAAPKSLPALTCWLLTACCTLAKRFPLPHGILLLTQVADKVGVAGRAVDNKRSHADSQPDCMAWSWTCAIVAKLASWKETRTRHSCGPLSLGGRCATQSQTSGGSAGC